MTIKWMKFRIGEIIHTLNDTFYMPCLSGDNATSIWQAVSGVDSFSAPCFKQKSLICGDNNLGHIEQV